MIEEIFLRITDQKYRELQFQIANILKSDFRVSLIDDSVLNSSFDEVFLAYDKIISLSKEIILPNRINQNHVSFFKISRVFSEEGNHLGWFVPSISESLIKFDSSLISEISKFDTVSCCIVDTDIATGSTKDLALRFFPGADFYAPIKLSSYQDLLDIEDLFLNRSLIWDDGQIFYVNYLRNRSFFNNRTSILPKSYDQISKLVIEFLNK